MSPRFLVRSLVAGVCLLQLAGRVAHAEEADKAPPRGPAEIIKRANEAREKGAAPLPPGHPPVGASPAPAAKEPEGELPKGHPPVGPSAASGGAEAAPHGEVGGDPHAGLEGAPSLARRPLSSAQPSEEVPPGSIRVRVLDFFERPVPFADVQLGTITQDNARTRKATRTGEDGIATFTELEAGDKLAYRVTVPYQGATYGSMPFRLPLDRGYDVVIRRLAVTRDPSQVVLYVGATSVELKDERLKIVQQVRLFNVGRDTYVFPEEGQNVPLPEGAIAFHAEDSMTDQRMSKADGGFKIHGSLPPGEATLTWGFDLPREGTQASLAFSIPWPTFAYRVLVDAAQGMQVSIDGMPSPELHEDRGRRFFVSEVVKSPGEPPLRELRIHLRGIPGPSAWRLVSAAIALLVIAAGAVLARKPPGSQAERKQKLFAERKAALLERARELEAEREAGEIGPEFHARATAELEDELAALLFEQSRAK